MTSVCENHLPNCKKLSECMAKDAIQSLNTILLNTIEEIDENNIEYSSDVTTKWKQLASTINEAYKIVLSENLMFGDVSSEISKILNGEYVGEENKKIIEHESDHKTLSDLSKNQLEKIDEAIENEESILEETSCDIFTKHEQESQYISSAYKSRIDLQKLVPTESLSTGKLELLENYKQLEITTNMLIDEYLDMHKKTLLFIESKNAHPNSRKSNSLTNEVSELIEQLNESIGEFTDTERKLTEITERPLKQKNDRFSNTEVLMFPKNKSVSQTSITEGESCERPAIKRSYAEVSVNLQDKNENVVQVMKEIVDDFQGYMQKIKHRIDKTKRDFDVLKTMLEGTILDCEKNIIKAKKSKVKSIRSSYNVVMEKRRNID